MRQTPRALPVSEFVVDVCDKDLVMFKECALDHDHYLLFRRLERNSSFGPSNLTQVKVCSQVRSSAHFHSGSVGCEWALFS